MILQALPWIAAGNARLLVLGTMPGAESLRRQQYYAHPQNQFWRLAFAAFGGTDPGTYPERVAFLMKHRVALWDVLETCVREGSLDANIKGGSERPNDILGFLQQHSGVHAVALNGGTAARVFRSLILPTLGALSRPMNVRPMPSTSPAHTVPFAAKLGRWRAAFAAVDA